jgi:hypothetical protein
VVNDGGANTAVPDEGVRDRNPSVAGFDNSTGGNTAAGGSNSTVGLANGSAFGDWPAAVPDRMGPSAPHSPKIQEFRERFAMALTIGNG